MELIKAWGVHTRLTLFTCLDYKSIQSHMNMYNQLSDTDYHVHLFRILVSQELELRTADKQFYSCFLIWGDLLWVTIKIEKTSAQRLHEDERLSSTCAKIQIIIGIAKLYHDFCLFIIYATIKANECKRTFVFNEALKKASSFSLICPLRNFSINSIYSSMLYLFFPWYIMQEQGNRKRRRTTLWLPSWLLAYKSCSFFINSSALL